MRFIFYKFMFAMHITIDSKVHHNTCIFDSKSILEHKRISVMRNLRRATMASYPILWPDLD